MNDLKMHIKDFAAKLQKDKKALLTVSIGLFGMLLVLVSEMPVFSHSQDKENSKSEYSATEVQRELENIISQVKGAGEVRVMLTFESDEETVWAKDSDRDTDEEGVSNNEKHIIIDSDSGETGLAVKIIYPRVRGVAIVCNGGDDPVVRSEIKSLVSALFDIGSNRISIARRAEKE